MPLLLLLTAAIIPRLPHLWTPILFWHAWRQADTAAIARNFYRDGMNILYPAIDWAGAGPGYVESEFPLFPFIVAGLYKIFGVNVVWGRMLAILSSLGAALLLARLCARYLDRWAAAFAAMAFSIFPINSYVGAAFMPESLMLLASVGAIDHLDRWSLAGRQRDMWSSAVFLALAIALKLPELFLGVPVAFIMWRRFGWQMFTRAQVWLYAAVALVPPLLWYWHAHQLKAMTGLTFAIWEVGTDKWGNLDLLASPSFYLTLLFSGMIAHHLAYAGAVLLVIGFVLLRGRRDLGTFKWWVGGAIFYFLVVARGNAVHDYYQLPILLPLSLWVGAAIAWAFREGVTGRARLAGKLVVILFAVLALAFEKEWAAQKGPPFVDFGSVVQSIVPTGGRVVVVDNEDPTFLYYIDRRGWHARVAWLTDDWLEARRVDGAAYLVSLATEFDDPGSQSRLARLHEKYLNRSPRSDLYVFDLGGPGMRPR